MQTKREYAISLGLAKEGRGRLSAAAHEAINKAIADGAKFSDASVTTVKSDNGETKVVQKDKDDAASFYGPTPAPIHNGGWYAMIDGKQVSIGGRNVCTKCGYSLDYQNCENPTAISPRAEIVPVMR